MDKTSFKRMFLELMENQDNPFHPLVWINGSPRIGNGTYIGGFSEINAAGANVVIGEDCDIASFVAINCADSHHQTLGLSSEVDCLDILIGEHVFIGSHSAIFGGSRIAPYSVIGAGTIVRGESIPPFSLAHGNPLTIKPGHYRADLETNGLDVRQVEKGWTE